MDETEVAVRGGRHYLYRAVDRSGKSVGSPLCNDRSMEAARATEVRQCTRTQRAAGPRRVGSLPAQHAFARYLSGCPHRSGAGIDPSLQRRELRWMAGGSPLGAVEVPGKGLQAA
ncbi:MAG: DDE-type integrase/transposase/recombinase [Steroidobacteraceae bacterium]